MANLNSCRLTLLLIFSLSFSAHAEKIIYVDGDADGANSGTSWTDAYVYLQDAFSQAQSDDEIRVAGGIYYPDISSADPTPTADRSTSFVLPADVTLLGGYAGIKHDDPDFRHFKLHPSVLSGEIGDLYETTDNSYTVIKATSGKIDGFTITAAFADGPNLFTRRGAGMSLTNGTVTVSNCFITRNTAMFDGAGLLSSCNLTLTDSIVSDNSGGRWGGGLYLMFGGRASITRCQIRRNYAGYEGGGIYSRISPYIYLTNSLIADNRSEKPGSGIWIGTETFIYNCTVVNNDPEWIETYDDIVWLGNSIVWGNYPVDENFYDLEHIRIDNSCLQDYPRVGERDIIADNPQFVDADGPDNLAGTDDDDFTLSSDSPCIDAVKNNFVFLDETNDLLGRLRVVDGDFDSDPVVDMGAYEYACRGNLTELGSVNLEDLAVFSQYWRSYNVINCVADFNNDNKVDMTDFNTIINNWLYPN